MTNEKPPIFILGVPRSGTTLLRTILNCHPNIACGPEAPWLAHQAQNIMALGETLTTGEHSYCKNFGVPAEAVKARIRQLIDGLFTDFARQQGKLRWAHKTPDDSMHAGFFTALFPEAKFIHLIRHPLDAALSNTKVAAHRTGVSEWHEQNILLEAGVPVKNNLFNSVLRWRRWNERIRQSLAGVDHFQISYEDMVGRPVETFGDLFSYLDEPFTPDLLDYKKFPGIFPEWEWGSADVQRAKSINTASVHRWKKELSPEEARVLFSLSGRAADASVADPVVAAADSPAPTSASPIELFSAGLDQFAAGFSLNSLTQEPDTPRWWFQGLAGLDWTKLRVLDLGSGLSPWPWFLALLGAQVTLIDGRTEFVPAWEELRRKLKLAVDWKIISEPARSQTLEMGSYDVVLWRSDSGLDANGLRYLRDAARGLKPGGTLAMSFAEADQTEIDQIHRELSFTTAAGSGLRSRAFNDDGMGSAVVWVKP